MKVVLAAISLCCVFDLTAQYKRFSLETNTALGEYKKIGSYDDGYRLNYFGYSARIQYNFPKFFSLNAGFGQEHQSFVNVSEQDLSPAYIQTSKIRTSEFFIPLTLRVTAGKKVMVYAEVGFQLNFKGTASIDAFVDYWHNDSTQLDYAFSYNQKLGPLYWQTGKKKYSYIRYILGFGINVPLYRNLHLYAEFRTSIFKPEEYFITDDQLAIHNIQPYSRNKLSLGLSYYFNWKKDSKFQFNTIYLKPIKKQ